MKAKYRVLLIVLSFLFVISGIVSGGLLLLCDLSSDESSDDEIFGNATAPSLSDYWTDSGNYGTTVWQGAGTASNPWLIQSARDLARLSYLLYTGSTGVSVVSPAASDHTCNYVGKYFKQTCDIDLSAHYWQQIGTRQKRDGSDCLQAFSGIYDGNGYTIDGVYMPTGSGLGYSRRGFFGLVLGYDRSSMAQIKNLTIGAKSYISGSEVEVAGLVGTMWKYVKIENCTNYATVSAKIERVGGIAGYSDHNSNIITNCKNYGIITSTARYTAGIIGQCDRAGTIKDCVNYGSVSSTKEYCAGIVGRIISGVEISDCINYGKINGLYDIGGICGNTQDATQISRCTNYGTIERCKNTVGATSYGGIVGFGGNVLVDYCQNYGEIVGDVYTGGIAGFVRNNSLILHSFNKGSVIGYHCVGGICGQLGLNGQTSSSSVGFCFNEAGVFSHGWEVGGIVGVCYGSSVYYCYNNGTVEMESESTQYGGAGGLIGTLYGSGGLSVSYNTGSVRAINGSYAGGLVAKLGAPTGSTDMAGWIYNCFNTGYVISVDTTNYGAAVGYVYYGYVYNSYYYSPNCSRTYGVRRGSDTFSVYEAADINTYKNDYWYISSSAWHESYLWDFNINWTIDEKLNDGFPILQCNADILQYDANGGILTDEFSNLTKWDKMIPTSFKTLTYDSSTNMSTVKVATVNGWEILSIPVGVEKNTDYTFSVDYVTPSYTPLSGKTGIAFMVLKSAPTGTDCSEQMIDRYQLAPNLSGKASISFNSGSQRIVYIAFNFGYVNDGQSPTFSFGNLTLNKSKIIFRENVVGDLNNNISREGYIFDGWWTDSTDGVEVKPDTMWDSIEYFGKYDTLYAHWIGKNYKVKFNSNGATSGSMLNQNFVYGQSQSLSKNTFAKTGYTFRGWATTEAKANSNQVDYADCEVVSNLTLTQNGTVNLYAVWLVNTYSVVFMPNGGNGSMNIQYFAYDISENLYANQYVKTGYKFLGWATTQEDADNKTVTYTDAQAVSRLTTTNGTSIILYAVWQKQYVAQYSPLGYWYVEVGMMPQTRVPQGLNTTLNNLKNTNSASLIASPNEYHISSEVVLGSYIYNNVEYCVYNNQWYIVEPIRWRLQGDYQIDQEVLGGVYAVQANITYYGEFSSNNLVGGDFVKNIQVDTENLNMLMTFTVSDLPSENSKLYIASQNEISDVATTYDVEFSDLLCDMLVERYYYTRTSGTDSNIKVYSFLGFSSQRIPTNVCGIRYIVKIGDFVCI